MHEQTLLVISPGAPVTGWVESEGKEGIQKEGVGDNAVYLPSWKTQAGVS